MEVINVVGCGMTGSQMPYPLGSSMKAAEWDGEVVWHDFDTIEPRNSPSSLPMIMVGTDKAEFVSKRAIEHGVISTFSKEKITTANAVELLKGSTLLVGAVDNDEVRTVLWMASENLGVGYVDIGVNRNSARVSWKGGLEDNHPFSPHNMQVLQKEKEEEKEPPCTLYATRKIAALAVELGVQSIATFIRGHDPEDYVLALTGEKAERGDMLGWTIAASQESITATPNYVGREIL